MMGGDALCERRFRITSAVFTEKERPRKAIRMLIYHLRFAAAQRAEAAEPSPRSKTTRTRASLPVGDRKWAPKNTHVGTAAPGCPVERSSTSSPVTFVNCCT